MRIGLGWRGAAVALLLWGGAIPACSVARGIGKVVEAEGPQGSGSVTYAKGEFEQIHAAGFDRVWTATLRALDQLRIRVTETEKGDGTGTVSAVGADRTAVQVSLSGRGDGTTAVKVRVGSLGDREASEAIQAKIYSNLRP